MVDKGGVEEKVTISADDDLVLVRVGIEIVALRLKFVQGASRRQKKAGRIINYNSFTKLQHLEKISFWPIIYRSIRVVPRIPSTPVISL